LLLVALKNLFLFKVEHFYEIQNLLSYQSEVEVVIILS
jgi:hypothetical protein